MIQDLLIEFLGQHNQVLALAEKVAPARVSGIPDSRLAREIESVATVTSYSASNP
jgi:hypothetical protein